MMCDCIKKINADMEENSFHLGLALCANKTTGKTNVVTQVLCMRIGASGTKAKDMAFLPARFCPFCGKRYEEEVE